jgi:metal-responsive CopG/Arc/MetJ family transcriptional regulator
MDKTIKLGITLPKSIVDQIDKVRGDIPRSRYILRALEDYVIATAKGSTRERQTRTTTTKTKKRKK